MKNKKIIFLTIAIVAVVLAGVLGLSYLFEIMWQQPRQINNDLSTDIPDIDIVSSISTQGNITAYDGAFSMADDNGVYALHMINDDGYTMIYSDFSSGTAEIMCTKSDCNHADEGCTAFVSVPGMFFTSNSRLYYVSDKNTVYEISYKDYSRKQIVEFGDNYLYQKDMILSNNEYFFTNAMCKKGKAYRRHIVAVNFETGEIIPLIEIGAEQELITAYDDNIYLIETVHRNNVQQSFEEYNIIKYNVPSGKTETMYTLNNKDTDYCFYKDILFYMNKNDMLLKKVNLNTSEEELIKDFSHINPECNFSFNGVNENYIIINFVQGGVAVVDIKSGTEKYNTLQRYSLRSNNYDELIPAHVVKDRIVFYEGGKTVSLTYDYIGKQNTTIPYFAYISDVDFYNNVKNHTVMEF